MDNPVYIELKKEPGHYYERRERKDGRFYVIDRAKHWDKSKGRMVFDKSVLLGLEVPGDPTKIELIGDRRSEAIANHETQSEVKPKDSTCPDDAICEATTIRVGAMEIIDHMFDASHVDAQMAAALASVDPYGDRKIVPMATSLMRYMMLHQTAIPDLLEASQQNHRYPYEERITETDVGRLYELLGQHTQIKMIFFQERYKRLELAEGEKLLIAYDSSIICSYSKSLEMATRGYEEVNGKTKSIKLFVLYEANTRQPIAWFILPSTIPDARAVELAVQQMRALGVPSFELVADSGFMSEANCELLKDNDISYVIRAPNNRSIVQKAFEEHMEELDAASAWRVDDERQVTGVKVPSEDGRFLYLFKNQAQNELDFTMFLKRLYYVIGQVKADNWTREKMDEDDLDLLDTYLVVKELSTEEGDTAQLGQRDVSFNAEALEAYRASLATFALISSNDMTPDKAYHTYFIREGIEECYACFKGDLDERTRVQSDVRLDGRVLIMFGASCAMQYFQQCLTAIKAELRRFKLAHKNEQGYKGQYQDYSKLLTWLENNSIRQILAWFDVRREVCVKSGTNEVKMSDPVLKRDQLMLAFLGLREFPRGYKELPTWEWLPQPPQGVSVA